MPERQNNPPAITAKIPQPPARYISKVSDLGQYLLERGVFAHLEEYNAFRSLLQDKVGAAFSQEMSDIVSRMSLDQQKQWKAIKGSLLVKFPALQRARWAVDWYY
ncbi:hypothetical protein MPER_13252, partial [Moniliophthora perniciosa FA553]